MGYGRFSPGFERYGGDVPSLKTILDGLNAARGSTYDVSETSTVYAENEAIARMLWTAWEQNQRFAHQFDPDRMTDFLPRWEKIFGIAPTSSQTETERRAVVKERMLRIGVVPTRQTTSDRLAAILGPLFLSYETIPFSSAVQWVPDASPAWPAGTPPAVRHVMAPGELPQWASTTAHILFRVAKTPGMTDGEFWQALGRTYPLLDDTLPAWVTWDWYTVSTTGSGFYFDETNLDHQVFD